MTRFVFVTLLVVLASRPASAQGTGTLPGGAAVTFGRLQIHEFNNPQLVDPDKTPESQWAYFNLAHCQCAAPTTTRSADYHETTFAYFITLQGATTNIGRPLDLYVGTECTNDTTRPMNCHVVPGGVSNIDSLRGRSDYEPEIPLFDFMVPVPGADMTCPANLQRGATLWAAVDTDGSGQPDYFATQMINIDTQPPPLPANVVARGTENGINISWTVPTDTTDIYAYQALCATANDAPVTSNRPKPLYKTAQTLCGANIPFPLPGTDPPLEDGSTTVTLPDGLSQLDSSFLCAENLSASTSGIEIGGLQNNVPYKVVLLVMDKFGNATGTYFTSTIIPHEVTDFWEELHGNGGSHAEGGLCLLAETYGNDSALTTALRAFRDDTLGGSRAGRWLTDAYYATLARLGAVVHGSLALRIVAAIALAPVAALALLWHWLTLPGAIGLVALAWWLRRRRAWRWLGRLRWLRVAAPLAVILLGGRAYAGGGGYQPYWENTDAVPENQATPDETQTVSWHAGLRIGPYVPDIDNQVGQHPGPYQNMFGGFRMLPMLDVDRILWSGFGQAGIGLSVGYLGKSAHAFASAPNAMGVRPRDPAAETSFRLVPFELSAVYRLTVLDDNYGIPVVPYFRGGLAYYLWWANGPNGISSVCKGGVTDPCDKNKALGASLGLQGAIGIAVRAERIDASTAMSMQQSGIQHAGLYAELSVAKVDGFGSETKLSVGDTTWFAGVDFEF